VATGSAPPPSVPTATIAEGPPADETALDALVPELQAFVEEERGLEFQEEIDLELLGEEEYAERTRAEFEEELADVREDVEESAAALQAVGLWPEGTDPIEVVSEFSALASLGFYDPESGEMVVRGTTVTPLLRTTLVHELTHALDDQHFDLDRPELDDAVDESSFAFSAVGEGSATRVEVAYEATLTEAEREEAAAEELTLAEGIDIAAFPPILLAEQQFVYVEGAAFVDALFDDGGNEAVNRALRRPPTTSEQILEPETWTSGEEVVEVPVPEAEFAAVDEGVAGQFLLHLLTGIDESVEATPEWDGDNSVLWRDGDQACLRIAIAGDVVTFEASLMPWAEQVGAELERDGDLLVVTSCR
jgi:hypothetical protein